MLRVDSSLSVGVHAYFTAPTVERPETELRLRQKVREHEAGHTTQNKKTVSARRHLQLSFVLKFISNNNY
uniref:Uncharacterized protein n=1 Tax=Heterorhabditis bacteriophora TaxID=37862 RepID=A0A1I7WFE1_HETBA